MDEAVGSATDSARSGPLWPALRKAKARLAGSWSSLPLHPIFCAVYFVLALAAANGSELIQARDLAWPLLISLGATGVIWALASYMARGARPGALVATVGCAAFSSFGAIATRFKEQLDAIGQSIGLVVLLTYALVALAVGLRLKQGAYRGVTFYLNLVTALLFGYATLSVARDAALSEAVGHAAPAIDAAQLAVAPKVEGEGLPDIFLIILDKYTATRMLRAHYEFDNSPFEDSLRARGFIVPQAAQANYIHTSLALAAMLNLRYLDDLAARLGPEYDKWEPLYTLVEQNRVAQILKHSGYRYIFFPSAFAATRKSDLADLQLPAPSMIRPEFETVWLQMTPIPKVHLFLCRLFGCRVATFSYIPESAELLDWKFKQLPALAQGNHPTFVFVHLTLPHEPYVYDSDCGHRDPYWPENDREDTLALKSAYVGQIECLNRKLLGAIDEVRERSSRPPIILLQADHGHGRLGRLAPGLGTAAPWQVAERRAIFAAYSIPGLNPTEVSDSISPVNILRLVIGRVTGERLPQLPNSTYWSAWERPYQFTLLH